VHNCLFSYLISI